MKFAPILAGGTLGLLLLTLATAKPITPSERLERIDTGGIDTLEVMSADPVEVVIDDKDAPALRYRDSTASQVRVRRQDRRLLVEATLEGWEPLKINVPPGVHRFVFHQGSVRTLQPLAQVELLATRSATWSGDVAKLLLREVREPTTLRTGKGHCDCRSGTDFSVEKGRVGELRAFTDGSLRLEKPDSIGVVYAWLGPKGSVSISEARHLDHVHLMPALGEATDTAGAAKAP